MSDHDDSFDMTMLDNYTSQKTKTAWSSQVSTKSKGRFTYSRRGCGPAARMGRNFGSRRGTKGTAFSSLDTEDYSLKKEEATTESDGIDSTFKPVRSEKLSNRKNRSESSENIHPNAFMNEVLSPKRLARPLNIRGRKKSRSDKEDTKSPTKQSWDTGSSLLLSPAADFGKITFGSNDQTLWSPSSAGSIKGNITGGDKKNSKRAMVDLSTMAPPLTSPFCEFGSSPHTFANKFNDSFSLLSPFGRDRRDTTMESDDGDSAAMDDSFDADSADDSLDLHSRSQRNGTNNKATRSKRSSKSGFSNNILFEKSEVLEPEKATVDDVIETMPSYQDLRFLVKELATQKNSRARQRTSWKVAPKVHWPTERRMGIVKWAKRKLGFSIRAGGGAMQYVEISVVRGGQMLTLLEKAVVACKERGLGQSKTPTAGGVSQLFSFGAGIARIPEDSPPTAQKRLEALDRRSAPVGDSMSDLPSLMNSLSLQRVTESVHTTKFETENESDQTSGLSLELKESTNGLTSAENKRLSLDACESSGDLMAHMHGLTPVVMKGRRPRLSIDTADTGRLDSISPFPRSTLPTPTYQLTCGDNIAKTPLMTKSNDLDWGSRPLKGRDWGNSECCSDEVIGELSMQLKMVRYGAGFKSDSYDYDSDSSGPDPIMLGPDLDSVCQSIDSSQNSQLSFSSHTRRSFISNSSDTTMGDNSGSPKDPMMDDVSGALPEEKLDNVSKELRRRRTFFAKRERMSLAASAFNPSKYFFKTRKSLFCNPSMLSPSQGLNRGNLCEPPSFFGGAQKAAAHGQNPIDVAFAEDKILEAILTFLNESELLCTASLVCKKWADSSTNAHARLLLQCVGCLDKDSPEIDDDDDVSIESTKAKKPTTTDLLLRPWRYLKETFPFGTFLSEGGFKQVYKVFNVNHAEYEAISIMDVEIIENNGEKEIVGVELAVSVMLSSLVRRGICPNFISTRGVFSCKVMPPPRMWGSQRNKYPQGKQYNPSKKKSFKLPKKTGQHMYIRMELCDQGDAEDFLKRQAEACIAADQARQILFQITFALYAAADKFSLKHYDLKLLNIFLKSFEQNTSEHIVLKYGVGDHIFVLKSRREHAVLAKLADYGTANVECVSNGQPVTVSQFTTLENTPPDFLILGDHAKQGHGHDAFGLGLCMLHLFTGHRPYEEIMEEVLCPNALKTELQDIWQAEDDEYYSVLRGVVGTAVEGDGSDGITDDTLAHTLYRFLVLFGIPALDAPMKNTKVWTAIVDSLKGATAGAMHSTRRANKGRKLPDDDVMSMYVRHQEEFSVLNGYNKYITRARKSLEAMEGGLDLLFGLTAFDPNRRLDILGVLNSSFMTALRCASFSASDDEEVFTYGTFSTAIQ